MLIDQYKEIMELEDNLEIQVAFLDRKNKELMLLQYSQNSSSTIDPCAEINRLRSDIQQLEFSIASIKNRLNSCKHLFMMSLISKVESSEGESK